MYYSVFLLFMHLQLNSQYGGTVSRLCQCPTMSTTSATDLACDPLHLLDYYKQTKQSNVLGRGLGG